MLNPFEIFEITKNKIVALVDCRIQVKLNPTFPAIETADIIEEGGVLNFIVESQNKGVTLTYPYPIRLNKTGTGVTTEVISGILHIWYASGSTIVDQKQVEDKVDVKTIKALLTGQSKDIKDPKTLVTLIADQIKGADLNHIELIVSTLYRIGLKSARFTGKYETAEIVNPVTKTINDSWLSAIAFRDINKAVGKGLVNSRKIQLNPIEKIINQDFSPI